MRENVLRLQEQKFSQELFSQGWAQESTNITVKPKGIPGEIKPGSVGAHSVWMPGAQQPTKPGVYKLQCPVSSKAHSPWSHRKQRHVHPSQAPDRVDSLACSSQLSCLQQWRPQIQNTTFLPSQHKFSQRGRFGTFLLCRCTLQLWQLWMERDSGDCCMGNWKRRADTT